MILNKTTLTQEQMIIVSKTLFNFKAIKVSIFGGILAFLGGVAAIIFGFLYSQLVVCVLGGILIILSLLFLFMPLFVKKNSVLNFNKLSGGKNTVKFFYEFGNDDYYVSDINGKHKYYYSLLTAIFETNDALYFLTDNASGFCIDKNGFEKGTLADLKGILLLHKKQISIKN